MYKKNKTNRRRNKKTLTKRNKRNKYKKGGNTNSMNKPLGNETIPDQFKILQNQRVLNRIEDTIQQCRDILQHLNFEKEILFQEKFELSKTYLSNPNKELYEEIHELYEKINQIQDEQEDLYNYHTQFFKIYDILSNTGEELTPDGRERYIDEYNVLAMEFREKYFN